MHINKRPVRAVIIVLGLGVLSGCVGGGSSVRASHDEQVTVQMQKKPDNKIAKNIVEWGGVYSFQVQQPAVNNEDHRLLVTALQEAANQVDDTFIEVMEADGVSQKPGRVFVKLDGVHFEPQENHGKKSEGGTYRHVHFSGGAKKIWFSMMREDVIVGESKMRKKLSKEMMERKVIVIPDTAESFEETIAVRHPLSKEMPTDEKLRQDLAGKIAKKYINTLMPKRVRKSMPLMGGGKELSNGVSALVRGNMSGAENIFQKVEQSENQSGRAAAKNNLAVLYAKRAGDGLGSYDPDRVNELLEKAKTSIDEAFLLQPESTVVTGNRADIDQWIETRGWITDQMAAVQESKRRPDRSSTDKLRKYLRK